MENKGNWAVISLGSMAAEKAQCVEAEVLPPLCRICCPCTETPQKCHFWAVSGCVSAGVALGLGCAIPIDFSQAGTPEFMGSFCPENEHFAFPGD